MKIIIILILFTFFTCLTNISYSADQWPADPSSDIPWDIQWKTKLTVKDCEKAFNKARKADSTCQKELTMPSQAEWNKMNIQEKALFLLNAERVDRGLKPFEGISKNVKKVAQKYCTYLMKNKGSGHTADGKDPWIRLKESKIIKKNQEFCQFAENFAAFWSSQSVPMPVERSIYGWIYDDSGSAWGHRHTCLFDGFNDNSGEEGKEGVIGIGVAKGKEEGMNCIKVIMNYIDPNKKWNFENY